MRAVKKDRRLITKSLDEATAIAAIEVMLAATENEADLWRSGSPTITYEFGSKARVLISQFQKTYNQPFGETVSEIWKWYLHIFKGKQALSAKEIFNKYVECVALSNSQPMKIVRLYDNKGFSLLSLEWVFKGYVYEVDHLFSDEEARLLILEDFDKERQKFETLNAKFDEAPAQEATYERPRIPESVRIEVWRRDGGKCARCGSRERLEYDHIVPISRGGSNTARNIELLCEDCNRRKSNNVV